MYRFSKIQVGQQFENQLTKNWFSFFIPILNGITAIQAFTIYKSP